MGYGWNRGAICSSVIRCGVADYQRNSSIAWIFRSVRIAQTLVGETSDLRYLVRSNSAGLHQLAALVRPIGGELPIGVIGSMAKRA